MRECKRCGKDFPFSFYSSYRGKLNKSCNICCQKYSQNYKKNRSKMILLMRERNRNKREELTEYRKIYRGMKKGKIATLKAIKKYEATHPERKRAWNKCVLLPKKPCIICSAIFTHKHHPDISKPLEIIYLCPLHHKQAHQGNSILA